MIICRSYSGFCPQHNKEYTIEIDYREIQMLGASTHFAKGVFSCDANEDENCIYGDLCPIYKQAPASFKE